MPVKAKLPPGKGKRVPLNMRTTRERRKALENAAASSGRSLVQEVEYRLDRSFLEEDHLSLICGDTRTAGFVREILDSKRLIEAYHEQSVWEDFECYEAIKEALKKLLARRAPEPSGKFKKQMTAYERYVEKELRPWKERGGGRGLLSNPDAGDPPPLKPSPGTLARAVGQAAADVVAKSHAEKALVKAIKAYMPEEE